MRKINAALISLIICISLAQPVLGEDKPAPKEIKPLVFESSLNQNAIELKLKGLLEEKGFTYRKDKDIREGQLRRLYFEKGGLAVDIGLFSLGAKGTKGVVAAHPASGDIPDSKDLATFLKKRQIDFPDYRKAADKGITPYMPPSAANHYRPFAEPVPEGSEALEERPPAPLMGKGAEGVIYRSINTPKKLEDYCRASLKRQGFDEIKSMGFKLMDFKRLRFERSDMAVELFFAPDADNGSKVIVVKYPDKNGHSRAEDEPFASVELPQQDSPGAADLRDIPRPEGSVRWNAAGANTGYTYILNMPIEKALEFYRKEMPGYGWALDKEISLGGMDGELARHKGKGLFQSMPIGTRLDLADILKQTYAMYFVSPSATAVISIYPNFVNPAQGAMADVHYNLKKGSR